MTATANGDGDGERFGNCERFGEIVAKGDRQTMVATVRSSQMGIGKKSLRQRDCRGWDRREWQRINDHRYRRLDVANGLWGREWGKKRSETKKIKKGWRSFSISALVRNSNSSLLITISDENYFVTKSVLINTFSDEISFSTKIFCLAPEFILI